ncbi:MAG: hypothetical protein A2063_07320 [Gallionellales bacterium GWA2_60_142]|nr:MAG: hypothetical protein A2063_07320 [Gallionellales bacterium GWA2_60_142]HCI14429.1 hypothetical protein [Gallionellaceae bacterium]
MDDIATVVAILLLAVVGMVAISVAVERHRISRFFVKASTGGLEFSVELHKLVQREVNKATMEALRRVASLDKRMVEFWERESLHRHDDWEPKMKLLEENVRQLEDAFSSATQEMKPQMGFALRELYWLYLKHARDSYASGPQYQEIRQRVFDGLTKLEKL